MPSDAKPSPPAPSRTQAERRATTEARLLDAAFDLVADHGVSAVTTAAVGQSAGYSRGIVNHHFGSRDQLMIRLAEATQGRFTARPGERRGRERVLNVVADYLAFVRSDPRVMRVFLRLWAATAGDEEPSLRDAFTVRDAYFRDYFEDAIAEGQADGTIRTDLDPPATAIVLLGLIRGIALQCQTDPALAADQHISSAVGAIIGQGFQPAG